MRTARTTDRWVGMAVSVALHACLLIVPTCERHPTALRVSRVVQAAGDAEVQPPQPKPSALHGDPQAMGAARDGEPLSPRPPSARPGRAAEARASLQEGSGDSDPARDEAGLRGPNAPQDAPPTEIPQSEPSPDRPQPEPQPSSGTELEEDEAPPPETTKESTPEPEARATKDEEADEAVSANDPNPAPEPMEPDDWAEVALLEEGGETPEAAEVEAAFDYAGAQRARQVSADDDLGPQLPDLEATRAEARRSERDGQAAPKRAPAQPVRGANGESPVAQEAVAAREARRAESQLNARSSDGSQGQQDRGESTPSWWTPIAVRVPPSPRDTEALAQPESGDVPTQQADLGMRQTPSLTPLARKRAATVFEVQAEAMQGEPDGSGEDRDIQDPNDARERVVATAEAVSTEEEAEPDRIGPEPTERTPPGQRAQEGSQGTPAAQGGTSLASFEGEEGALAIDARRTERGVWITEVDRIVRASWQGQPLPMALRGQSVKGDVAVRFVILDSGRTEAVAITRSSGNAWLDAMAEASIPKRVPRPPRSVGLDRVVHEITFRYR